MTSIKKRCIAKTHAGTTCQNSAALGNYCLVHYHIMKKKLEKRAKKKGDKNAG